MAFTASIVLYRHRREELYDLLSQLEMANSVLKVWLVDNGECEWASELTGCEKFIYIKAPKNGGYGYGHNLVLSKLSLDVSHHIICNPDIYLDAKELDEFSLILQNYQEALVMPNVTYPDGTRQELCKLLPHPGNLLARRFIPVIARHLDRRYMLRDADFSKPFFAPSLSGCFMVCRTDALKAVKGFDERFFMYMEDVDLSRRLAARGGALYLPVFTVKHAFQKGSYKNKLLLKYHIKSAISYFNKWGWFVDYERRSLNLKCRASLPRA